MCHHLSFPSSSYVRTLSYLRSTVGNQARSAHTFLLALFLLWFCLPHSLTCCTGMSLSVSMHECGPLPYPPDHQSPRHPQCRPPLPPPPLVLPPLWSWWKCRTSVHGPFYQLLLLLLLLLVLLREWNKLFHLTLGLLPSGPWLVAVPGRKCRSRMWRSRVALVPLRYWHILHLNCCTTTTSIMASRLCRSSSSVTGAGRGWDTELASPWGSGGSRHADVDVGPSARASMAARLLAREEADMDDAMGAPEDRRENRRQD